MEASTTMFQAPSVSLNSAGAPTVVQAYAHVERSATVGRSLSQIDACDVSSFDSQTCHSNGATSKSATIESFNGTARVKINSGSGGNSSLTLHSASQELYSALHLKRGHFTCTLQSSGIFEIGCADNSPGKAQILTPQLRFFDQLLKVNSAILNATQLHVSEDVTAPSLKMHSQRLGSLRVASGGSSSVIISSPTKASMLVSSKVSSLIHLQSASHSFQLRKNQHDLSWHTDMSPHPVTSLTDRGSLVQYNNVSVDSGGLLLSSVDERLISEPAVTVSFRPRVTDSRFEWAVNQLSMMQMDDQKLWMMHALSHVGDYTASKDVSVLHNVTLESGNDASVHLHSNDSNSNLVLEGGATQTVTWQQSHGTSTSFVHKPSLSEFIMRSTIKVNDFYKHHVDALKLSTATQDVLASANVSMGSIGRTAISCHVTGATAALGIKGRSGSLKLSSSGQQASFLRLSHHSMYGAGALFQWSSQDELRLHDSTADLLTLSANGHMATKGNLSLSNMTAYQNVSVHSKVGALCSVTSNAQTRMNILGSKAALSITSHKESSLILGRSGDDWLKLSHDIDGGMSLSRSTSHLLQLSSVGNAVWATDAFVTSQGPAAVTVAAQDATHLKVGANQAHQIAGLSATSAVRLISSSATLQMLPGNGMGTSVKVSSNADGTRKMVLNHYNIEVASLTSQGQLALNALRLQGQINIHNHTVVQTNMSVGETMRQTCFHGVQDSTTFGRAALLRANAHCYFISKVKRTMAAAMLACERLGATLVTVGNDVENTHVRDLLRSEQESPQHALIGLSDVGAKNHFRWVAAENSMSGSSIMYNRLEMEPGSGYYGAAAPDNAHTKHCAVIGHLGKWFLADCNTNNYFICERGRF